MFSGKPRFVPICSVFFRFVFRTNQGSPFLPTPFAYRMPLPQPVIKQPVMKQTLGVLGGGQLGRMMAEAGHRLGIAILPLDPAGAASPAGQVAGDAVQGSFKDQEKIRELAKRCDVITAEILVALYSGAKKDPQSQKIARQHQRTSEQFEGVTGHFSVKQGF